MKAAYLLATALLGLATPAAAETQNLTKLVQAGVQHIIAKAPASGFQALSGIKSPDCTTKHKATFEQLYIYSITCPGGAYEALGSVKKFDAYYPPLDTLECAEPYAIDMPPNLPKGPAMAVICGRGDHKVGFEVFFIPPIN